MRTAKRLRFVAVAAALAVIIAACSGAGGPAGKPATKFPEKQSLAKDSSMQIVVENAGAKRVPNINVTVKCGAGLGGSFMTATDESDVADPERPQFVVNKIPTPTEQPRWRAKPTAKGPRPLGPSRRWLPRSLRRPG